MGGNLKISLADMKLNLDKVTTDNTATELAVKVARSQTKSNDVILKDVKKSNASLRKDVSATQLDTRSLNKMVNEGSQNYAGQIGRLGASIVALSNSSGMGKVASEVISNGNCTKVCAGTTPESSTIWRKAKYGFVTRVSMYGCAFTGNPVVTTSLGGRNNVGARGASSVYSASKSGFTINLFTKTKVAQVRAYKWHVEWIAVG